MKTLKIYFNSFGNKIEPNFPYEQLLQFKMVIQNNDQVLWIKTIRQKLDL
jgi:hypothetical protein